MTTLLGSLRKNPQNSPSNQNGRMVKLFIFCFVIFAIIFFVELVVKKHSDKLSHDYGMWLSSRDDCRKVYAGTDEGLLSCAKEERMTIQSFNEVETFENSFLGRTFSHK